MYAQVACRLTHSRGRLRHGRGGFNPNKMKGTAYSHLKSELTHTAIHISARTQELLTATLWSLMKFIS